MNRKSYRYLPPWLRKEADRIYSKGSRLLKANPAKHLAIRPARQLTSPEPPASAGGFRGAPGPATDHNALLPSAIFDRISDGFILVSHDYTYLYANRRIGEITGIPPSDLIGKKVWDVFPEAVGSGTYMAFEKAMKTGQYTYNLDYYEPLDLYQENHIYPVPEGLSVFIRDISEQKRNEERLQKSRQLYQTVAGNIPGSAICVFDTNLTYTLVEGDLIEKFGFSKEDLLNRKVSEVLPSQQLSTLLPHFRNALGGTFSLYESSTNDLSVITRFIPLRNPDGVVTGVMTVGIDVTEIKNAQRYIKEVNTALEKKIEERTEQLERLNKELESFSYSVAHDLRAPLRAVSGYAAMLLDDYSAPLDREGQRLIREVDDNARKMGSLIEDLLAFSKLGKKEVKATLTDMNRVVSEALAELQASGEPPAGFTLKPLHFVVADGALMKQVIINLLSNAIKYSSKKPSPSVEVSSELTGDSVVFSVKDNGVGFDRMFAGRLFGVFQRLHSEDEFEGTGVGLAIVQRIIEKHNGRVWADGKPNEGASFYFSLPVKHK